MDKHRIESLATSDLIDIIAHHSAEYTAEALAIIHAELQKRNEHSALEKAIEQSQESQNSCDSRHGKDKGYLVCNAIREPIVLPSVVVTLRSTIVAPR